MAYAITRWIDVPGFEDCYQVSDKGQIFSKPRTIHMKDGRVRNLPARIMKPVPLPTGYETITLRHGGVIARDYVHRIVLYAFRGLPGPGEETCHGNGDPADNRIENLRWDSHSSNVRDTIRHGNHNHAAKRACIRGHKFDQGNTRVDANGHRWCRTCSREASRRSKARRTSRGRTS